MKNNNKIEVYVSRNVGQVTSRTHSASKPSNVNWGTSFSPAKNEIIPKSEHGEIGHHGKSEFLMVMKSQNLDSECDFHSRNLISSKSDHF